jgi:uncharacterized membrane-anchored protein YhcB (DUF1043 family)
MEIPLAFWISIAEALGVPAALLIMSVVLYALRRYDEKRLESEQKREQQRSEEHMQKWNDMLTQHKAEVDRSYNLFVRQAEVLELHARLLTKIDDKLTSKSICPIRKEP